MIPSSSDDPMKLNPDWFLTLHPIGDIYGGEVGRIGVFWLCLETSCLELKLLDSISEEVRFSCGLVVFVAGSEESKTNFI